MTQHVVLDNLRHKDLRVRTERSSLLGDARESCLALPGEFRQLQAHFPIVYQHVDGDVGFQPIVLFGLEEGQNLFLNDGGWDAAVVPMALQREPFAIGRAEDSTLQLHIDMESPRVVRAGEEEGTALFLPHGGFTDYLDQVVKLMEQLHEQAQLLPAFIDALKRLQLLEPFVLDIEMPSGEHSRLTGLFSMNEERLSALSGSELEKLAQQGFLLPIYMQVASLSQLPVLLHRYVRR